MAARDTYYGILLSSFWDGDTGQRLQTRSKDALILAAFLSANRFANMIGLYELSLGKLSIALPALKGIAAIRRALDVLREERYAYYDPRTEFVWVREMARVRMHLTGEPIPHTDNRRQGAIKVYNNLPLNPFLGPFYDRYCTELGLPKRRDGGPFELQGATKGATQAGGVAAELEANQIPLQQQEYQVHQESVIQVQEVPEGSENRSQESGKAAAAPRLVRPQPVESPADNIEVITSIVVKDILPLRLHPDELPEATKARCAKLRVAYDSGTVRKAIESAQVRATVKR